jgi:uncharacterized Zn finger protein
LRPRFVTLCTVCKTPMKVELVTPRTTTFRCKECGTVVAKPTSSQISQFR